METRTMKVLEKIKGSVGKRFAFDLDLTLTDNEVENWSELGEEEFARELYKLKPRRQVIDFFNELAENNVVYVYTARSDYRQEITKRWLRRHGVNYSYYVMNKPHFDWYFCDKSSNIYDLIEELENDKLHN